MSNTQCTSARIGIARNASLAVLLLALVACVTEPTTRPQPNAQNLESRARTAEQSGNFTTAANLYAELAGASTGNARADYLIDSARMSIEAQDLATARRRLGEARTADRDRQQRVAVLLARIELEQGRPQAALEQIAALQQPVAAATLRDAAAVRGRALFRLGRHADAVRALVEREVWLDDASSIRANQRMIWDGLREPSAAAALAPTGDPIVDGWLALAPLSRMGESAPDLRRDLLAWRETYTDHPAAGGLLADLLSALRAEGFPAQIALLLPLSARERNEASAIRDGFFAAHLKSARGSATRVRVYDTGVAGAEQAYLRAQLDGADFIVGPLLRPEVDAVIGQAGFVPTLALNFAQTETPFLATFYQFALAPQDEARMVAQYAAANGATTAVALVPSNERGYGLRDAFRAEFEALGGELLAFSGYDPSSQDFSGPIRNVLNIARSTQRYQRLAANLGVPIEFEPRRRQDVDLIFLAASSRMGRLIAPQLRYNSAGDIPTYATADIFEPGAASASDLNGVIFADTPAAVAPDQAATALKSELEVYWPQRSGQVRYYGLGFDAYRLVGSLYNRDAAGWPMPGMSGDLTLAANGRIHRSLPLAQFRNGRPVALETGRGRGSNELVGIR